MQDSIELDSPNAADDAEAHRCGAAVSLRGVRHAFDGGVVALDGIDLEVSPGEFLAVLGPSGCGKSTLLRLIAGLERPTGGSVSVRFDSAPSPSPGTSGEGRGEGHSSPGHGRAASRRAEVAYVFQDAHLLPWRTVLHNVALPLELMGVRWPQRLAAAARAVRQVGLGDAAERYPGQLSGGMRMRVSLARAMVTRPRLLLLDEPFAALDEITRQRLDEHLRALWASRGMTVVFVTHSTAEAAFLAARAVVMSRGPGRVVLDRAIDLPPQRDGLLRATPAFARETRFLYEALERGGA